MTSGPVWSFCGNTAPRRDQGRREAFFLLDLSIDELLVGHPSARAPGKRGPASRLQQQVDAIAQLPKARQRVVSELLDAMLAQHGTRSGQEASATA